MTAIVAAGDINPGPQTGATTGMMLGAAVALLALPSAVLGFTASFDSEGASEPTARDIERLETSLPGSRLARGLSLLSAQLYPFTPAKNPNRPDRSVTVAVRLDPQAFKTITVAGIGSSAMDGQGPGSGAALSIAPTVFSLGVARGYRNFAPDGLPTPAGRRTEPPELTHYALAPAAARDETRFAARSVPDERQAAGRASHTFAGDKEDQVDLSGSYRVGRNLAVTAGVRYSQDRERLVPLTDGKQDSQAVYVGTQFRF